MSLTTTVSDLRPGDQIRWPDGQGGHVWPTVLRNWEQDDGAHEILLGGIAVSLEDSPAAQGKVMVCVCKTYPGDVELIVRRAA